MSNIRERVFFKIWVAVDYDMHLCDYPSLES
jgi:hypothetical protein